MDKLTFDDFIKLELISGTIVKAEDFPRAKNPAFKVWVDFGPQIGTLQTSAQITKHYDLNLLIGKSIIGCVNLGERNIAGFISQFLLVGFKDDNGDIVLIGSDTKIPDGQKLC